MNTPQHEAIRSTGWLSGKPKEFQDQLLARSDQVHFEKGVSLYEAFDDTGGLLGVAQGIVALHLPERGSANTFCHIGGPGFWTGDAAALSGQERRITIVAKTDCTVLRLSRAQMMRLGEQDANAWRFFSEIAARNLTMAIDVIEALKHVTPISRVAMTLLNLHQDVSPDIAVLPLSQTDIAAAADLSRSSVNTAMKSLKDMGLIKRSYGGVEISDLDALRKFASQV